MDSTPLPDHAWDDLVAGVAAQHEPTLPQGADAPVGFQVLSLEQYAASHARSMHQPHDR